MESVPSRIDECLVRVPVGSITLDGNLTLPEGARGVVLFAHGSGSSRHSPRSDNTNKAMKQRRSATQRPTPKVLKSGFMLRSYHRARLEWRATLVVERAAGGIERESANKRAPSKQR